LPRLRESFAKARKLFFVAAENEFTKVPQFITANLLNVYRKPIQGKKKSALKRIFGSMIFDDWLPEFAVQERSSFSKRASFSTAPNATKLICA
jgi:hypothetical protein